MYAILITRKFSGNRLLFPVVYTTKEEAEQDLPRIRYSTEYNDFEVLELLTPGLLSLVCQERKRTVTQLTQ